MKLISKIFSPTRTGFKAFTRNTAKGEKRVAVMEKKRGRRICERRRRTRTRTGRE